MSLNAARGKPFNRLAEAVKIAAVEFANDNNGQLPTDPSQLAAYLKQPIDAATIQKYLKAVAADPPPSEVHTLTPALKAYTEANGGKTPENPFDVVPYLSTPEQHAAFVRLIQMPPEAAALMPALKAYAGNPTGECRRMWRTCGRISPHRNKRRRSKNWGNGGCPNSSDFLSGLNAVSAPHAVRHGDSDLRGGAVSAVILGLNRNRIDSPIALTQTVSSQIQGQWPGDFPI